ncbi:hypothetical protein RBS60_04965 [Sinomonas sp. ASV486]|uniref:hypothetical protein n=1 Tax=Sinomonas sp. ASV486 TaxID=3051170 RepID=UPI0027DD9149|nr:hypothetical protein [Sinomonas sp. ASV486]MDQ4489549.1 hypothetical protein [Sinomonas sp. ASV486]
MQPTSRPPAVPSIHVRAAVTWLALFPLVTGGLWAMAPFDAAWPPVLRTFVLTVALVPLMVYLVVPALLKAVLAIAARRGRMPQTAPTHRTPSTP